MDVDTEDMGPAGVARQYARQLQLAIAAVVAVMERRLADRDTPAGRAELRRDCGSEGEFSCTCGGDPMAVRRF